MLSSSIKYVLNHPHQANENGFNARKKCIEKYSFHTTEKNLIKIFKSFEKKD